MRHKLRWELRATPLSDKARYRNQKFAVFWSDISLRTYENRKITPECQLQVSNNDTGWLQFSIFHFWMKNETDKRHMEQELMLLYVLLMSFFKNLVSFQSLFYTMFKIEKI